MTRRTFLSTPTVFPPRNPDLIEFRKNILLIVVGAFPMRIGMSKIIAEQGQLICASPTVVWSRLTQVNQWTQWLTRLKATELNELPKLHAVGKVTPITGRPYHFEFSRFDPEAQLQLTRPYKFGTSLIHTYNLTRNAEGVVVSIELSCKGGLELQVGLLTRRKMARELHDMSVQLKAICEKDQVESAEKLKRLASAS
jgi:hypothetical protein